MVDLRQLILGRWVSVLVLVWISLGQLNQFKGDRATAIPPQAALNNKATILSPGRLPTARIEVKILEGNLIEGFIELLG